MCLRVYSSVVEGLQSEENQTKPGAAMNDHQDEQLEQKSDQENQSSRKSEEQGEQGEEGRNTKPGERSEKENTKTEEVQMEESVTQKTPGIQQDEVKPPSANLLSSFRSQSDSIPLLGEGFPPLQPPPAPPHPFAGLMRPSAPPPLPQWSLLGPPPRHMTAPPPFHTGGIQHRPFATGLVGTNYAPNYGPSTQWGPSGYGPPRSRNPGPGLLPTHFRPMYQNTARPVHVPQAPLNLVRPAIADGRNSGQMASGLVARDTSSTQGNDIPVDMEMSSPENDIIEQLNKEFWRSQVRKDDQEPIANSENESQVEGSLQESLVEEDSRPASFYKEDSRHCSADEVYDPEDEIGEQEPISPERIEEVETLREKKKKRQVKHKNRNFRVSH